ncbi:MAG: wax ester/triacylglycerol synthase family O-acyltransferase [Solirubrobacterales bacterium]
MSGSRHTMPAADAAWLHMDSRTNPMVVNALVRLASTPPYDRVAATIEERMVAAFPRFRQRVDDRLGRTPAFEDDPNFEIGNHVHRVALPAPGDRTVLEAKVGDLITPPLDPGKPLWHAYLIEGYGEGAAMLWRIHHSIADGIALARVMLSITDGPGVEHPEPPSSREPEHRSALGRLAAAPGQAASAARTVAGAVVHEGTASLAHPEHLRELASGARRDASTVAKLLAAPADAPTGLRRPLAGTRRVAWSEPFPLDRVKDSCHRRRVTVNDMLLTALAATLAAQLGEGGELPEEIHAMIPVNLRPLDRPVPAELGNDFALVLLALPLGDHSPAERLRRVNAGMEELKHNHEAPISYGLLNAMGMTPPWVEERLIGFFTDKASMVVTNVPGPPRPLEFAGAPIESVLVWAPCSGSLGLTVSIFSYAGEVSAGFMADTALLADPAPLARGFEAELARLC